MGRYFFKDKFMNILSIVIITGLSGAGKSHAAKVF